MKTNICVYDVGEGNTELLAEKIGWWQKDGAKVRVICPRWTQGDFENRGLKSVEYVIVPGCRKVFSKIGLVFELLKRSVVASLMIGKIVHEQEVIYSISAVLDEVLVPFFAKIFRPHIRWVVLFENEVYWRREERIVIRALTYLFYLISLRLIRKADIILTVSDELREILIGKGYPARKIILTGNAVRRKEIKYALQKVKKRIGGLFLGRLDENKGVFELVEMMKIIVKLKPDFHLNIGGSGEERIRLRLENIIKDEKLENNITLLGYIEGREKYEWLCKSKIYIFPSKSESFGVSLLEAICSGEWAVAYDLPIYHQLYRNQELVMVEAGSVRELARNVIQLDERKGVNKAGLMLLENNQFDYRELARKEYSVFRGNK